MSGEEAVAWVVCASGTWGQWVRVRRLFSTVRGMVKARVRLAGSVK